MRLLLLKLIVPQEIKAMKEKMERPDLIGFVEAADLESDMEAFCQVLKNL